MFQKCYMVYVVILLSVVSGYGQTLNLVTGMTFASDKALFNDKTLSRMPNGFFKLGLGYVSKDKISVSLDYSFNVKYINLTSTIPIWDIKKKENGKNN